MISTITYLEEEKVFPTAMKLITPGPQGFLPHNPAVGQKISKPKGTFRFDSDQG